MFNGIIFEMISQKWDHYAKFKSVYLNVGVLEDLPPN